MGKSAGVPGKPCCDPRQHLARLLVEPSWVYRVLIWFPVCHAGEEGVPYVASVGPLHEQTRTEDHPEVSIDHFADEGAGAQGALLEEPTRQCARHRRRLQKNACRARCPWRCPWRPQQCWWFHAESVHTRRRKLRESGVSRCSQGSASEYLVSLCDGCVHLDRIYIGPANKDVSLMFKNGTYVYVGEPHIGPSCPPSLHAHVVH